MYRWRTSFLTGFLLVMLVIISIWSAQQNPIKQTPKHHEVCLNDNPIDYNATARKPDFSLFGWTFQFHFEFIFEKFYSGEGSIDDYVRLSDEFGRHIFSKPIFLTLCVLRN